MSLSKQLHSTISNLTSDFAGKVVQTIVDDVLGKMKGVLVSEPKPKAKKQAQAKAPEYDHSPKRGRARTQSPICSMVDCGKPTRAKNLCTNHYQAHRAKVKAAAKAPVNGQPATSGAPDAASQS